MIVLVPHKRSLTVFRRVVSLRSFVDLELYLHRVSGDAGVVVPGINDGYTGAGPDLGAFEYVPSLVLDGRPGERTIFLSWEVNTPLPSIGTWQIVYDPPTGVPPSPVTGIPEPTRAYTLTGLTNYVWYTVTLDSMLDGAPVLTDTTTVMPTDLFVHLPLVLKDAAQ